VTICVRPNIAAWNLLHIVSVELAFDPDVKPWPRPLGTEGLPWMTTRRPNNEARLAAIDARLPKPAFEETPGLEWLGWLSLGELDILEAVYSSMDPSLPADLDLLPPDLAPLVSGIVHSAQGRMMLGWPTYDDARERYGQIDQELGLLQKAHELRFGRGREWW
jgi:hypothetical protein